MTSSQTTDFAVLTENQIRTLRLVRLGPGATAPIGLYEKTSVNLSIGAFLPSSRESSPGHCRLMPQEMVWVLSKEIVDVPNNVTGYLVGKRALASQGIMAINTGMADPTFVGPLSVILVNFSDRPQDLEIGNVFAKVVFHSHSSAGGGARMKPPYDEANHQQIYDEFLVQRTREARALAPTFLNLQGHSKEIASVVGAKVVNEAVIKATIAGALLAILAIFLPIGAEWASKAAGLSASQAELTQMQEDMDQLRQEIAALRQVEN